MDGCLWFVGGDFNMIRLETKKIGVIFYHLMLSAILEFNNCIQECGLLDLSSSGYRFS